MLDPEVSTAPGQEGNLRGNDVTPLRISASGYTVVAVMLSTVWVLGTLFNAVSLCVFACHKKLHSPTNMFVMALNLCDLCMSFLGTFMAMTSAWKKEWLYGDPGCVFEAFTVYFLGLTSMYLLSAISLDRYIIIAKPLEGPCITHKVAGAGIGACCFGGLLWASLPLVGWNRYVLEGGGISCSVDWENAHHPHHHALHSSYIFTIFVFAFLLPLGVMAFSYYHVYMTVRTISRNPNWSKNSRVVKRNLRVEKKLARTFALMMGAFLVCWLPYAVFSFTIVFQGSQTIPRELATYPAAIAKCQGLLNPILYVGTNRQFRQAFYGMIPIAALRAALWRREKDSPYSENDDNGDDNNDYDDIDEDESRIPSQSAFRSAATETSGVADAAAKEVGIQRLSKLRKSRNSIHPAHGKSASRVEVVNLHYIL
ncbi:hypothetical protein ACOMHN_050086 [Nucella lapillus]